MKMKGAVHFTQLVVRFANSSRASCREWAVFEKETSAKLSFRVVLVDQCLKARIASQRVPHRIES
jgi:hypothetical protein